MDQENVGIEAPEGRERVRARIRIRFDGNEPSALQGRAVGSLVHQSGEDSTIVAPVPGAIVELAENLAGGSKHTVPRDPAIEKMSPRPEARTGAPGDADQVNAGAGDGCAGVALKRTI